MSLAHEVISPITGIATRAEALKRHFQALHPDARWDDRPLVYFRDIDDRATELVAYTQSILSMSETSANRTQVRFVRDVVYPAVQTSQSIRRRRGRPVILYDPDAMRKAIPIHVRVDPVLSIHVLCNLLNNSIKYSFKDMAVELSATRDENTFSIHVLNWGIGVPKDESDLIFEPLIRGRNAHEASVRGAGLGLFISRQIMKYHGGSLVVQRLTQPTVFTATFPL